MLSALPYRNPLFPIVLTDEAPHTFYLRIEADSVTGGQLVLWHVDDFRVAAQNELPLLGMLLGIILMLGLISLLGWIMTRDTQLLSYVAMAAAGLLAVSATTGLLAQQIFPPCPDSPIAPFRFPSPCISSWSCLFNADLWTFRPRIRTLIV